MVGRQKRSISPANHYQPNQRRWKSVWTVKLFKHSGDAALGCRQSCQLVFRYADKMFMLSQEMLDIVTYSPNQSVV